MLQRPTGPPNFIDSGSVLSTAALSATPKNRSHPHGAEKLWLAAIVLAYLGFGVRAAWLRPFVFHEFSTLFVASQPRIGEMFRAIPADGNPPLYFVLARLSLMLPLKAELALRLPAILAYLGAAVTLYWFVRRDAGRAPAWLAMSVFLGSSIAYYAVDARPYPLLLFFTGLALCCWRVYCVSGDRTALAGIALSVAGAIGSHQYGVIYTLFPLFIGEAARTLRRRKLDLAVWTAGAVGSLTVFLTFPPMLRGQKPLLDAIKACPAFAARPHWSDLKLYSAMLPRFIPVLVIFWVVVLILWIALAPKRERTARPPGIPAEDWAAAIAVTLLLPVILIVARLGTNYFQGRYGIGSGLGIALLCGMLLSQLRWRYTAALGGVAAAYGLIAGLLILRSAAKLPEILSWTDTVLRVGSSQELRSGEPIVVANATEFSPLWWYSDEQMRARVHYLTDASYTARQSWLVPEYSLLLERAYLPMRLDDYQTWLAGRSRFLLYCSGDPELEWIRQRLTDDGWRMTLLQSAPAAKAAGAATVSNREIYEVSR